jgi:DNA-binding transcriptional regulator LsrR (DeoR family)
MIGPTKRDMQTLAAWYFSHGKYDTAAKQLGIGRQSVKNTLYRFRRQERVETNLELALRFQDEIAKLRRKPLARKPRHGEKAA